MAVVLFEFTIYSTINLVTLEKLKFLKQTTNKAAVMTQNVCFRLMDLYQEV